ncbi:MAG: TolC family protein, partial [Terriglobia bacterium]
PCARSHGISVFSFKQFIVIGGLYMPRPVFLGVTLFVVHSFGGTLHAQTASAPGAFPSGTDQQAIQAEGEVVEIQSLIEELARNNPEIRAARYRYEAATKRPSYVGSLPDPKIGVVNFGVGHPLSTLKTSNFAYWGVGISQEVPFPGKLALASEEAQKEADSDGEMYRQTVLDNIAQLKVAYYDWFYISKAIEITQKNADLLERFERIARARYAVGRGIQQDILKAQVERSELAQSLEILLQKRASIQAKIHALLNRSSEIDLGHPGEVKRSSFNLELDQLQQLIERNSPGLRAQQLMVDGRAVGIERAKKEYRPDFNFNFQWQKTSSLDPDYYMATAEIKVPLYFWRKQRYGLEEANARSQESRQSYQATRQSLLFKAKDQFLIARTSERLLALYESGIIPQATVSLDSAVAGYQVGSVDFLTLIDGLTTLLNFEMQYYEELVKHEQALAGLEPIVAIPLTQP